MTVTYQTESEKINELADSYRNDGYEVIIEPRGNSLPFDLGGYMPDLIARKGDSGFIVEVKSQAAPVSVDSLVELAREVRLHEGWRLILVTAQDIPESTVIGNDDQGYSWGQIAEQLDHADRIAKLHEPEAAYLIMWIALERVLRLHAVKAALPIERLATTSVIRQLYSQGELSMDQLDSALACYEERNRVVHGLKSPNLEASIHDLGTLVRDLLSEWSAE